MRSIGDFAESLILNQVTNIKKGKELPPNVAAKTSGLAPAGIDISKTKVPASFMKQILGEQFTPQDAEPVESIPELVWNEPKEEPKQEPQYLTEETAKELFPLLEEVRDLLKEMCCGTTAGMLGTKMGDAKSEYASKLEKKYGYIQSKSAPKTRKQILKASIKAKLKK
jgi:hypothetical protein